MSSKRVRAEMSLDDIRQAVQRAVQKRWPERNGEYAWVREFFDGYCIVEREGKLWRVPWSIANEMVELGDPAEVEESFEPVEAGRRFERVEWMLAQAALAPAGDAEGWVWPAEILRAGTWPGILPGERRPALVTRQAIQAAARHFEGAPCYVNHQEKADLYSWAGTWKGVRADGEVLRGELHLLKSESWLREKLLAARELGALPGVSIQAIIATRPRRSDGKDVLEVAAFLPQTPRSADLVMHAGAGGRVLPVAAGADPEAALAAARALYQVSSGSGRGVSRSAQRSHQQGATMKETIQKILASLRALSSEAAKQRAAAIEAELSREDANYETLLAQAGEALAEAAAQSATQPPATQVQDLRAQVETLQAQVRAAQEAQAKADWRLLLASKLAASKLPQPIQQRMRSRLEGTVLTAEQLDAEIAAERETYAAVIPSPARISGRAAVIEAGLTEYEKLQIALDRMMGVTHQWREEQDGPMVRMVRGEAIDKSVPSFRGIREAYIAFTGDHEVRGVPDESHLQRIRAEWNNAGFPQAFAATLHRLLLQDYAAVDYGVMNLVTESSSPDFKTQERVRVGYLGDLADVDPESADYAEIAAPTDEKATFSIGQKGNIVTVTRKAILNDDLGIIGKIVGRLGRSAARTLAQHVTDFFVNNPAIYDGDTWFHANHGNLGSTALSAAEFAVVRTAFRNFTEKDSGKKLGLHPRWLMVPTALEGAALKWNQAEYLTDSLADRSTTRYMFGQNDERVIVNYLLSDADDWYVAGDPAEAPFIEVSYLQGRREPELFLADGETTSERMFLADKIRYKIRHEYKAVVIDFRNVYKEVVTA